MFWEGDRETEILEFKTNGKGKKKLENATTREKLKGGILYFTILKKKAMNHLPVLQLR